VAALPGQLSSLGGSTRAELLEEQHARLDQTEARLLSLGRAATVGGWALLVVLAVPLALTLREEHAGSGAVGPAVGAALLAVATIGLLRHQQVSRRLWADLRRWSEVDREPQWRQLPVGDVPTGLLGVHDARDDARLPEVAAARRRRAGERVYQGRIFAVAALDGLLLPAAVIPFGGLVMAEGDVAVVALAAASAAVGVVTVVVAWARLAQLMRRRQHELNRATLEERVYVERFRLLHGGGGVDEAAPVPLAGRLVALVAALLLLSLVGWRISTSSGLVLAVVGALVLLLGLVLVLAVLRQRRPHVVSLLAPGDGLLQRPDKPVTVTREGGDVVLAGAGETLRIPGHDVVGVVPVSLAFAMAPPAVLVVTPGDPVVVAGRGVDAALSSP
jgi:hypothetical protein